MTPPGFNAQACLQRLLDQCVSGLRDEQERRLIAQRLPFEIDGKVCGSVTPDDARWLAERVPGLVLDEDSLALAPYCARDSVPVLEQMALQLRDAHRLPRWRGELMAVQSDDGSPLGVIERAAMRPLGLHMAAAHLVGVRPDGRFWLQQRAFDKDTDPGLWDTLAGGLVGTERIDGRLQREDLRRATVRESWEEAGIPAHLLTSLQPLPTSHINRLVPEGHMVQDNFAFLAQLPASFEPRNMDGEVAGFAHFDRAQIEALIDRGQLALEPAVIMLQLFIARGGA